jgi:hypothetical protein
MRCAIRLPLPAGLTMVQFCLVWAFFASTAAAATTVYPDAAHQASKGPTPHGSHLMETSMQKSSSRRMGTHHAKPAKSDEPMLITWLCPAIDRAAAAEVPAVLIYCLGEHGQSRCVQMFEFIRSDDDVGDAYVVLPDNMPEGRSGPRKFHGPLGARKPSCSRVHGKEWPSLPFDSTGHYSGKNTLIKIAMLDHIPQTVRSVVLIDADTHSLPGSGRRFAEQLSLLQDEQFIAVGHTGVRERSGGRLFIPPLYAGINGGVMAFDLHAFRRFAKRYCPTGPWYTCVAQRWRGQKRGGLAYAAVADQTVWMELLTAHPKIHRYFPCGFHAETQVLTGLLNRLILERVPVPVTFCPNNRPAADQERLRKAGECTTLQKWTAPGLSSDDCSAEINSPHRNNGSLVVALTHDAGGQAEYAVPVAKALMHFNGSVAAAIADARAAIADGTASSNGPGHERFQTALAWYKVATGTSGGGGGPHAGSVHAGGLHHLHPGGGLHPGGPQTGHGSGHGGGAHTGSALPHHGSPHPAPKRTGANSSTSRPTPPLHHASAHPRAPKAKLTEPTGFYSAFLRIFGR